MRYEEFVSKKESLEKEYKHKVNDLLIRYCHENNPVKVGDVVTDHYHTIKVESMEICYSSLGVGRPCMVYYGIELTKEGVTKKKQPRTPNPAYQGNVRMINGQKYDFEESTT